METNLARTQQILIDKVLDNIACLDLGEQCNEVGLDLDCVIGEAIEARLEALDLEQLAEML